MPENTKAWWIHVEWLFPILKYIRLRREVDAWRSALWWFVMLLAPVAVGTVVAFYLYLRGWSRVFSGGTILAAFRTFINREWEGIFTGLIASAGLLSILTLVELGAALRFVRHRPGRRRPLCTKQTFKFILLASRTWLWVAIWWAGVIWLLAEPGQGLTQGHELAFMVTILTALITSVLVVMGATSVQAALAVIALQDDRRCEKCGYFLIGLTVPRCPECGTPFDPAKLEKLSVAGDGENGGDAGDP